VNLRTGSILSLIKAVSDWLEMNDSSAADVMAQNILYLERNMDGTIGGSYRSLLYLVRLLDKTRYHPVVAFYREHHLLDDYRKAGCTVLLLSYPPIIKLAEWKPLSTWAVLAPLRGVLLVLQKGLNFIFGTLRIFLGSLVLLARERISIVHLNNGMLTAPELLFASKLLGVKTVVHQRGIGTLPGAVQWLARLVDHVVCVSDAARLNLVRQGIPSEKCTTIHNGIAPEEFLAGITRGPEQIREALGIPADCLIIGIAGMIRGWKGQLVLVKAMVDVRDKHPKARCLIIGGVSDQQEGDRAYRDEIASFIQANHLEAQVTLIDYQSRIAEFIQIFDIMVHTAIDPEPFSRSVLEGMTLGRPMIATRTGGTPEAIEDGISGILVPPNDPKALADKINELLCNPDLRRQLGVQAQERIKKHFMIESNVKATEQVYRAILCER
jgi:glycosyltransferase involved in cell wall biosynthesis